MLLWSLLYQQREMQSTARIQAVSAFQKDLVYRLWATSHGGVYVPVTEQTPPSPYLAHVEERDITTPSGRALTLMNPAYMTRQVHEMGQDQYGLRGHITSLNPIRTENEPDEWERQALETFTDANDELSSVEDIDGVPHLRLMRPLITKAPCLKCHSEQGYKVGDVRGGISVSVPLPPLAAIARHQSSRLIIGLALLWLLGLMGVSLAGQQIGYRIREHGRAEKALARERDFTSAILDTAGALIIVLDAEGRITSFNQSCEKTTGYTFHEVQGRYAWELLLPAEEASTVKAVFRELRSGQFPNRFENCWVTRSGERRLINWSNTAILDQEGSVEFVIGTGIDITKQRHAEEEIVRLSKFPNENPNPVLRADVNGAVLYANEAATPLLRAWGSENCRELSPDAIEVARRTFDSQMRQETEMACEGRVYSVTFAPVLGAEYVNLYALDITDRKQDEMALRASEARHRSYIEVTGQLGWTTNARGEVEEDIPTWRTFTGQSEEEVKGTGWSRVLHPDDLEQTIEIWRKAVDTKSRYEAEYRVRRYDGAYHHFLARGIPMMKEDGSIREWVGTSMDITDRKLAEKALLAAHDELEQRVQERTAELSRTVNDLQQSEARLADAQHMAHLGNWDWNIVESELWWSDEIYRIFGLHPQECDVTYEAFMASVHPDDRAFVQQSVDESLSEHKPYSIDHRIVLPDGAERIVHERAEASYDAQGKPLRMMGTVQDVTVRKQTEHALLEYQKQLRSLASELTLAEEHQRRTIAEELHDEVGQLLTGASMKLELLEGTPPEDLERGLVEIRKLIQQAIKYARTLTFELSPPRLYTLGFASALEWLAEQMQEQYSIRCEFEDDELPKPMADEVKVLLYRIVRELLHNIVKHAAAREAKISLDRIDGSIRVSVEDDGVGFEPSQVESDLGSAGGFGLFNVRERLNYLKGNLAINSAAGRGTKTIVTVPLDLSGE